MSRGKFLRRRPCIPPELRDLSVAELRECDGLQVMFCHETFPARERRRSQLHDETYPDRLRENCLDPKTAERAELGFRPGVTPPSRVRGDIMKNTIRVTQKYASGLATLALVILSCLLLPNDRSIGAAPKAQPSDKNAAAPIDQKRARMALGQVPLSFEVNRGQFAPQVQFVSRGIGYKAFLTQTETVFVLRKPEAADAATVNENGLREKVKGATHAERAAALNQLRQEQAAQRAASKAVVRMSLEGANVAPKVSGLEELPGKINYFRGNDEQKWIRDVPTYGRVLYEQVYPGVDLIYYGQGRQLEYDLVVAPGADPNRIAFNFEGAERLEVDSTK